MNRRASREQGSLLSLNPQALLGWESWTWLGHRKRGVNYSSLAEACLEKHRQTPRVESVGCAHWPFRLQGSSQLCTCGGMRQG